MAFIDLAADRRICPAVIEAERRWLCTNLSRNVSLHE